MSSAPDSRAESKDEGGREGSTARRDTERRSSSLQLVKGMSQHKSVQEPVPPMA